jgi:hypothetical protein
MENCHIYGADQEESLPLLKELGWAAKNTEITIYFQSGSLPAYHLPSLEYVTCDLKGHKNDSWEILHYLRKVEALKVLTLHSNDYDCPREDDIILPPLLEISPLESFTLTGFLPFSQRGWKQFASRHDTLRHLKLDIKRDIRAAANGFGSQSLSDVGPQYTVSSPNCSCFLGQCH